MKRAPPIQKRRAPTRSQNTPKKIALAAASALNAETSQPASISERPNSSFSIGSAGDILPKAQPPTTPANSAANTAGQRVLDFKEDEGSSCICVASPVVPAKGLPSTLIGAQSRKDGFRGRIYPEKGCEPGDGFINFRRSSRHLRETRAL